MPAALSLVILLAADPSEDPSARALVRATREALGDSAEVVVRRAPAPFDEEEASTIAHDAHARVVATVVWSDDHRRATIRFHDEAAGGRWVARDIGFAASDAPDETGRTVGFAIASMLPESAARAAAPPAPAPPPPSAPPPASAPTPAPEPGADRAAGAAPRPSHGAIDAGAAAALVPGGEGGGIGGSVAGTWFLSDHIGARVALAARGGEVASAQASSMTLVLGAGLAWRSGDAAEGRRLAFGGRLDFLVLRDELAHFSNDDAAAVRQARWLPGADLLADGSVWIAGTASIFLAFGGEAAFGRTDVIVRGAQVASLSPFHLVAEGGVRARF